MKKFISLVSVLVMAASFTACGKNKKKIVDAVDVATRDIDEQKFVTTDFRLDIGDAELPFLHLPLPKNYGYLRLYRDMGYNRVALDVNLTEIAKLPGGEATLPNGSPVPVDTMGAGIIEIAVPGIKSKVYVAYQGDIALVGFAIAIKQLDGVGRAVGNIGVFPNFSIGKVDLTAGVFTSEDASQTGIAVFANLAGLINGGMTLADAQATVRPISTEATKAQLKALARELIKVKNTKQVLDIAKE